MDYRSEVQKLEPRGKLEEAGKYFLLYKIEWAMRILSTTVHEWGY